MFVIDRVVDRIIGLFTTPFGLSSCFDILWFVSLCLCFGLLMWIGLKFLGAFFEFEDDEYGNR